MVLRSIKNLLHLGSAFLATVRYFYPAKHITVIGITGTDGKTTTATLIYHLLRTSGNKAALISTVEAIIGSKKLKTGLHVTTPDPWMLQKLIKQAVDSGCKYLILEMTSHGLDQHRLLGTNPSIAVLTNITHEHLDYHGTYEKYFQSKMKLMKIAKTVVINKEDSSYKKIKRSITPNKKVISYGLGSLTGEPGKIVIKKFPQDYNRLNATAAILTARELGISEVQIIKRIRSFKGVVGRMDEINNKMGIRIIVDFAHTPGALESVLKHLKKLKKNDQKLIAVFGSAGDRDIGKREMMGQVAGKQAKITVHTDEERRYGNVDGIIDDISIGVKKAGAKELIRGVKFVKPRVYIKISERGEAITVAIQELAKKGDTVVICGKGHEQSMSYSGTEHLWSDHEAVKLAISGKVKRIRK